MPSSNTPASLTLLGRIDLVTAGASAVRLLAQSKIVGLLALLSVPSLERYVRRDRLADMLWPELDPERARSALRKALHAIRATLGPDAVTVRGDEDVALASAAVTCDAAAFTAAADSGFLMQALQLYTGELMPGFRLESCSDFTRWLEEEQASATERAAGAAWALAQRLETESRFSDATGMARRAVRFSWRDERALRRALMMLDRLGDRAGAIALFEEFLRRLRRDFGVEPSDETTRLAEQLRSAPRPPA